MKLICEVIDVSQLQNEVIDYGVLIFRLELGKAVDLENVKHLRVFLNTLIEGGLRKIIVDMKSLEYIDSAGIGTLINTTKMIRGKGGDVVLTNVSSDIRNIFNIINLQDFIKVFNLEIEAVDYFRYR